MSVIDPRNKAFAHLDRLAVLQAGGKPAPVSVEIDLSNRCNLGCEWCHFAYTHTKGPLTGSPKPPDAIAGGDLMDTDLARAILDQLAAAGAKAIVWTGGGEPTLHPSFEWLIGYAASCSLEQGIYTNGTRINPSRAAVMRRHLTWAYVSLDECDAESYLATKGGGPRGFANAYEGVRNLAAADGDATIGVGFLLHRDNWHRTDEMVELARALGAQYVQFRPTILYDQMAPGERPADVEWLAWAVNVLKRYEGQPDIIADIDRFRAYHDWRGHGYATCWFSGLSTVITPNGRVWRCVNKREHAGALLGDLSTESFADLWARSGGPCAVDDSCRVMCRGHLSNLTLDEVLQPREHAAFV